MTALWLWLIKSTIVLAFAWAVTACLRKRLSAAARHAIWSGACALVLLMPLLSQALPTWLPLGTKLAPPSHVAPAPLRTFSTATTAASNQAPQVATAVEPSTTPIASPVSFEWPTALMLVWLLGIALFALRRAAQHWRAYRLLMRAATSHHGKSWGLSGRVRIGPDRVGPGVVGLLRPSILLPDSFVDWEEPEQRAALAHEAAHVQRRDPIWQFLADAVQVALWWHPLAWIAQRQICELREIAADDRATRSMEAVDYAQALLEIYRRGNSSLRPAAMLGMARPRNFKARITTLLDPRAVRRSRRGVSVAITVGLAGVALGLGCAGPVEQPAPETVTVELLSFIEQPARLVDGDQVHKVLPNRTTVIDLEIGSEWRLLAPDGTRLSSISVSDSPQRVRIYPSAVDTAPAERPEDFAPAAVQRSTQSSFQSEIRFWNTSARTLEVFWIRPDGSARSYGKLADLSGYLTLNSWVGHLFELRGLDGRTLYRARVGAFPTKISITGNVAFKFEKAEPFRPKHSYRSKKGSQRQILRVANRSDKTVNLRWIDYRGRERWVFNVGSQSGRDWRTFVSHPWRIYQDQRLLGTLVVGQKPQALVVGQDGELTVQKMLSKPKRRAGKPLLFQAAPRAYPAPYGHGIGLRYEFDHVPVPQGDQLAFVEVQFSTDGERWTTYTKDRTAAIRWINHHGKQRCQVQRKWQDGKARSAGVGEMFEADKCLVAGQRYIYRVRGITAGGHKTAWSNLVAGRASDYRVNSKLANSQDYRNHRNQMHRERTMSIGQPAELSLSNTGSKAANLFWLDQHGLAFPYGRVEPGAQLSQPTRVGDVWLIKRGVEEKVVSIDAGNVNLSF